MPGWGGPLWLAISEQKESDGADVFLTATAFQGLKVQCCHSLELSTAYLWSVKFFISKSFLVENHHKTINHQSFGLELISFWFEDWPRNLYVHLLWDNWWDSKQVMGEISAQSLQKLWWCHERNRKGASGLAEIMNCGSSWRFVSQQCPTTLKMWNLEIDLDIAFLCWPCGGLQDGQWKMLNPLLT